MCWIWATSDKIRIMAFYLYPDFIKVSLKTWDSTSDKTGIITKDLCLICTENEEQICLTSTDWSRAITHLSATKKAWKISNIFMKIVYWRSTYFLSVLIMSKHNLHIILKFGCLRPTAYLCSIWVGNMTRAKWLGSTFRFNHYYVTQHDEKPSQENVVDLTSWSWASS
jgi:hypothetical protein